MSKESPTETCMQRRRFVRGGGNVIRPPWADETRVRQKCVSCGDCISACPEAILFAGPARTPVVKFGDSACTFCGDCAAACDEGVFRDTAETPWTLKASITSDCLLNAGVSCRSCTDACDENALKFTIRAGSAGSVDVMTEACTGCGACQGMCPVGAISLDYGPMTRLEAAE